MGWTNWPPQPGLTDIQAYDFLIQLWKACRERAWALGSEFFPRTNLVWESGTIDYLTQNPDGTWTLTDSDKDWQPNTTYCTGDRWTNYVCEELPYIPRNYDVVIDFNRDDPRACVRAQITANTPSTLTLSDLSDHVTAGLIPSVSALVGKTYRIIKRNGLWWSDRNASLGRWLDWPNDQELDKGSVASSTTTTLTINDPKKRWPINEWAGKDLLVYAGGKLARRTIASNTPDTLTFSAMPDAPGGVYVIVAHGGKATPGKPASTPFWWYGGASKPYWSHHPDDQLGVTLAPAATVSWSSGAAGFCEDQSHAALDVDLWSEVQEECSEADKCYSPGLFKTLRGIQLWLEGVAGSFVEAKNYDGAEAIPNFTTATWFHAAGINSGSTSVSGPDGDGNYFFNAPTAYEGIALHWTVLKTTGDIQASGSSVVSGGKVVVGTDENLDGKSVIYSAGWTRYHPREFTYLYERSAFIPDVDSGLDGEGVIDPPRVTDFEEDGCFGVGMWVKRGPSTGYKGYNEYGFAVEGEAFQTGICARYAGDDWHDTGTGIIDPVEVSLSRPSGQTPDLQYWDRFYEGQHPKPPYGNTQKLIEADRVGVATGGSNRSLVDTAKNWWNPHWYSGGVLRIESGTATSGSGTHVLIEAFKVDPDDERHCFWQSERFVGFAHAYAEFILEVDKVVGGQTVTTKLPITGVSGRNVSFAAVPGFSVSAGDAYRIREPKYNLNRYKGKMLRLIDPATSATHDVVVTHSDDNTLFFAPQSFTVGADWAYQILEHDTGGVWKWDGTKWIVPTGNDPRGAPWHDDGTENLPHKVKRYGRLVKGDYIAIHLFDELYRAINLLRWTRSGLGWSNRYDEFNAKTAQGVEAPNLSHTYCEGFCVYTTEADAVAAANAQHDYGWTNVPPGGYVPLAYWFKDTTARPWKISGNSGFASFIDGTRDWGALQDWSSSARFGWAKTSGVPQFMNVAIDFFAFAAITPDDLPAGTFWTHSDPYDGYHGGSMAVFDNNGDDNLRYRRWSRFAGGVETSTPGEYWADTVLGSVALPTQAQYLSPAPFSSSGGELSGTTSVRGYAVTSELTICRWDVNGGMNFVV
jgi:hypothetical protein